jgi:hypothetical protein
MVKYERVALKIKHHNQHNYNVYEINDVVSIDLSGGFLLITRMSDGSFTETVVYDLKNVSQYRSYERKIND